ncbi:MAG TPA: rhodanese-like domain-containing protein [Terriglobales bacterium]|jgi:rhodanese-related sulfurtransferase|nr:rhodanese-like domain-containing protein [Terriglobales bacterium]
MPDDLRISADELRRRMEAGEEFTIIDVRNPHAWAEATDMAAGAIRVAIDDADEAIGRIPRNKPIVTYCT